MNTISKSLNKNTIITASILVPLVVAVLLFLPYKAESGGDWVKFLPHVIAIINSTTVFILLMGFYFIKNGQIANHRASMISALILGVIFLICYLIYHASVPSTPYGGQGVRRAIYYFFLISHILLSIVVVPFVLFAFYFAFKGNIIRHKKLVKYAFPIWLYVSVTGVIVYFMIRPFYG